MSLISGSDKMLTDFLHNDLEDILNISQKSVIITSFISSTRRFLFVILATMYTFEYQLFILCSIKNYHSKRHFPTYIF